MENFEIAVGGVAENSRLSRSRSRCVMISYLEGSQRSMYWRIFCDRISESVVFRVAQIHPDACLNIIIKVDVASLRQMFS
jgi:hypothetical protein